eukprot:5949082-Prymnesium_polylepis.1
MLAQVVGEERDARDVGGHRTARAVEREGDGCERHGRFGRYTDHVFAQRLEQPGRAARSVYSRAEPERGHHCCSAAEERGGESGSAVAARERCQEDSAHEAGAEGGGRARKRLRFAGRHCDPRFRFAYCTWPS